MPDIATLGIEVNSSPAVKAAADLDKLTNSARRVEEATQGASIGASGLADTATRAGTAMGLWVDKGGRLRNELGQVASAQDRIRAQALAAAGALDAQSAAALSAAEALQRVNVAANQNARVVGVQRANVGNLAAQFQDVAVSAQMGMGALQIGLQQGTQLAAVIATMERPLVGLGQAFMSVISPVSLLVIGLVALTAAILQAINWGEVMSTVLRAIAEVLPDVAQYAAIAGVALAVAFAPAIARSVLQLSLALGSALVGALQAVALAAAANPFAAMVLAIAAVVSAAIIFRDELTRIFGFDIVGGVKTGANYIINSFRAAFEDVKFLWNQLPNIVGYAAYAAAEAVVHAVESMINKATGLLNTLIAGANAALSMLPGGFQLGEIGEVKVRMPANPFANDLSSAVEERNKAIQDIMNQDTLGSIGEALAKGADYATSKLKELAKAIVDVDEKKKKKTGKSDEDKYDDIVKGANARIASLKAEQAGLFMTETAARALRYEQDLLNQAQRQGIELTATQRAEFAALALTMAETEVETNKIKEALAFTRDTAKSFFFDLKGGLKEGKTFWESFRDSGLDALDKLSDKLLGDFLDSILQVNSAGSGFGGGGGGGILGIIGSIFGGLFGGSKAADPWDGLRSVAAAPAANMAATLPARPAAANSNAQQVRLQVDLSSDLEARVLQRAGDQSVAITRESIKSYDKKVLPSSVQRVSQDKRARG